MFVLLLADQERCKCLATLCKESPTEINLFFRLPKSLFVQPETHKSYPRSLTRKASFWSSATLSSIICNISRIHSPFVIHAWSSNCWHELREEKISWGEKKRRPLSDNSLLPLAEKDNFLFLLFYMKFLLSSAFTFGFVVYVCKGNASTSHK